MRQQKPGAAGLIGDRADTLSSVMRGAVATDERAKEVALLGAVKAAGELGCTMLTPSGCKPDNPLRKTGDMTVVLSCAHNQASAYP